MRSGAFADQVTVILLIGMILFFSVKIYDYLHFKKNHYYRQIAVSLAIAIIALVIVVSNYVIKTPIPNSGALVLALLSALSIAFFVVKGVNERNRK